LKSVAGGREVDKKSWLDAVSSPCWKSVAIQKLAAKKLVAECKSSEEPASWFQYITDETAMENALEGLLKENAWKCLCSALYEIDVLPPDKKVKWAKRAWDLSRKIPADSDGTCSYSQVVPRLVSVYPFKGADDILWKRFEQSPSRLKLLDYLVAAYKLGNTVPMDHFDKARHLVAAEDLKAVFCLKGVEELFCKPMEVLAYRSELGIEPCGSFSLAVKDGFSTVAVY
jgi:hypothetical protein